MAAKNLREVILKTLIEEESVFLSASTVLKLEGELADFFSHEIMKYRNDLRKANGPYIGESDEILTQFFNRIFKRS